MGGDSIATAPKELSSTSFKSILKSSAPFNSFKVQQKYWLFCQKCAAYNDRIEDELVDTAQREGSSTRYLQYISIRYTWVAENKTKVLVAKEVTNQVINLLAKCVDSIERVQLSKWKMKILSPH